ncbi:MAG: hypothetical protein EBR82_53350, partial [Caulobacteraceae bacterium]|nr:hypothetical protein [Caulobacteraceae bacterium]
MALPILDGNQTSTTLATTVSGGAHYPNHIIASGTVTANVNGSIIGEGYNSLYDLINDGGLIVNSIANPVTIGSIPAISGTVTANDFSEWQEISTRYWKADQSDWIINVSQYSAIRLYIDGDNTASISNGFWIKDAGDTYCEQDYIIWNGRSSVN